MISAQARRRKMPLSGLIRGAIGLPAIDNPYAGSRPRRARGAHVGRSAMRAVKVSLRDAEERAGITACAIAVDATDCDYMRMSVGLPRLRPRRVMCGAAIGNHNRWG